MSVTDPAGEKAVEKAKEEAKARDIAKTKAGDVVRAKAEEKNNAKVGEAVKNGMKKKQRGKNQKRRMPQKIPLHRKKKKPKGQ